MIFGFFSTTVVAIVSIALLSTFCVTSKQIFCCSTAKRWLFNPTALSHINDKGLPSEYVIRRYGVYGLFGCAEICQAMPLCLSFAYEYAPKDCILYSSTSLQVGYRTAIGYQYFDRDAFVLKGKDSTGGCSSHPCQNGGTCVETCGEPVEYFCICQDGFHSSRCHIDSSANVSSTTATGLFASMASTPMVSSTDISTGTTSTKVSPDSSTLQTIHETTRSSTTVDSGTTPADLSKINTTTRSVTTTIMFGPQESTADTTTTTEHYVTTTTSANPTVSTTTVPLATTVGPFSTIASTQPQTSTRPTSISTTTIPPTTTAGHPPTTTNPTMPTTIPSTTIPPLTTIGPFTTIAETQSPVPTPECFMGSKFGDKCFLLVDDFSSWFAANSVCALLGGHLATIDDRFTQDYLADYSNAQRWIGVFENVNHPEGPRFENVDGSMMTFDNYFDDVADFTPLSPWEICIGHHSREDNTACDTEIHSQVWGPFSAMDPGGPGNNNGLWRPKRCTDETFFICEMPLFFQPIQRLCDGISPLLTWRNEALTDFVNVTLPDTSCFFGFVVSSSLDFHDARYVCARQGGIVPTFSYQEELDALTNLVGVSARTVWIGYSRSQGNPFTSEEPSRISLNVSPCVNLGDESMESEKCCRRDPGSYIETNCVQEQSYVMVVCKIPGPLYS